MATFTPADTADYRMATKTVDITVTKAPLTATAHNAVRIFGQPNQTFTVAYSGFVNGDNHGV